MPAEPLVIDGVGPSDVRVVASALELQNNKTLKDAYDHNVRLKERKERDSGKHLRAVAEEAAHDFTH